MHACMPPAAIHDLKLRGKLSRRYELMNKQRIVHPHVSGGTDKLNGILFRMILWDSP